MKPINIIEALRLKDVSVILIPKESVVTPRKPKPMSIPLDTTNPIVSDIKCPKYGCTESYLADDIIDAISKTGEGTTALRCGFSPSKITPPPGDRCSGFLKIEIVRLTYSH